MKIPPHHAGTFAAIGLSLCCSCIFPQDFVAQPDPFPEVKDPVLHSALERLTDVRPQDFRRPEVVKNTKLVLEKVADGTLPAEGMFFKIQSLIEGAIMSGDPSVLPALTSLARHQNLKIRGTVASAQRLTTKHPQDLLLELVHTAESALPGDLSDKPAAQERFEEFASRIATFCTYTPFEQRGPAEQAIERFLRRYDDPSIRQYYESRLRENLTKNFPLKVSLPESPVNESSNVEEILSPGPKQGVQPSAPKKALKVASTSSPGEQPTSTTWRIIVVLSVAGCGLLWLLLKRRS